MENKTENYSLKIKYNAGNKNKIISILTSYKLEADELKLKYAKNWLAVRCPVDEKTISKLEKKLLEIGKEIMVEKVKEYNIWIT